MIIQSRTKCIVPLQVLARLRGKTFGVNISRNKEIWNQPVYAFEFKVVGSAMSNGSGSAYRIHSKMFYTDELEFSSWDAVNGTPNWKGDLHENEYILELDSSGKITGGYFVSGNHPQLFWKPTKEIKYEGEYAGIEDIYQASTH